MNNEIVLKSKSSTEEPHSGWGAGPGSVIYEEYICPCGKGIVVYEKDDIPGFRDSSNHTDCVECGKKYSFRRGIATTL